MTSDFSISSWVRSIIWPQLQDCDDWVSSGNDSFFSYTEILQRRGVVLATKLRHPVRDTIFWWLPFSNAFPAFFTECIRLRRTSTRIKLVWAKKTSGRGSRNHRIVFGDDFQLRWMSKTTTAPTNMIQVHGCIICLNLISVNCGSCCFIVKRRRKSQPRFFSLLKIIN